MIARNTRFFDKSFDFLICTCNLLSALTLDIKVLTALSRPRFAVVLEVLSLCDDFASGHIKNRLKEVFRLHSIASLLREIIDLKFKSRDVILFVFFVNKLVTDLKHTL